MRFDIKVAHKFVETGDRLFLADISYQRPFLSQNFRGRKAKYTHQDSCLVLISKTFDFTPTCRNDPI